MSLLALLVWPWWRTRAAADRAGVGAVAGDLLGLSACMRGDCVPTASASVSCSSTSARVAVHSSSGVSSCSPSWRICLIAGSFSWALLLRWGAQRAGGGAAPQSRSDGQHANLQERTARRPVAAHHARRSTMQRRRLLRARVSGGRVRDRPAAGAWRRCRERHSASSAAPVSCSVPSTHSTSRVRPATSCCRTACATFKLNLLGKRLVKTAAGPRRPAAEAPAAAPRYRDEHVRPDAHSGIRPGALRYGECAC